MKKNDDFLLDIESDIDKDWKDIADKFRQEKIEEEYKKEPVRPVFPSFEEFYLTLFRILTSWDGREHIDFASLHKLLHGLFIEAGYDYHENREHLPESFHVLWNIMCDPRSFGYEIVECPHCRKKFNVFFKEVTPKRVLRVIWDTAIQWDEPAREVYKKNTMICYNCGYHCRDYVNRKVVCVFEIPDDVGEGDVRKKFRDYI
jgi:hypothetical protein